MKHQETHPSLNVEGCFGCKISGVKVGIQALRDENAGADVTGGMGTREYVKKMYSDRRAAGQPDPEPANKKAAAFAPARGVLR